MELGSEHARVMSVFDPSCSSRAVLEHATGRWGGLVLVCLLGGPLRFAQVRREVEGIGDRMLTQTLQRLEGDGLLERREHSASPPHVTYALTGLGRPIAGQVADLIATIYAQLPGIVAHQRSRAAESGEGALKP